MSTGPIGGAAPASPAHLQRVGRQPHRWHRRAVATAATLLAVLAAWLLGPIAVTVLVVALVPAAVVVPAGLIYGTVAAVVLRARRRAVVVPDPDLPHAARALAAARFQTRLQAVDHAFHRTLLSVTIIGGAVTALFLVLGGASTWASGIPAPDDGFVTLLGGAVVLVILALLAAIPIAAVLIAAQVRDRAVQLGEGSALAAGTLAHRAVRASRMLALADAVIGVLVVIGVAVATGVWFL